MRLLFFHFILRFECSVVLPASESGLDVLVNDDVVPMTGEDLSHH